MRRGTVQKLKAAKVQPPEGSKPMLRKIDRVILRVAAVTSAAPFSRAVPGLELIRQDPHLAAFKLPDGGELILHDDTDQPFEQIYYLVKDVRDLYRRRAE